MLEKRMIELIEENGLNRIKGNLKKMFKPSIRMKATKVEERNIGLGHSKLGGRPDLPVHLDWPEHEGKPLYFIAQLNMEEIKSYDFDCILPERGIIYFFYDALDQPWGYDPNDRGRWKVFHCDDDAQALARRNEPAAIIDQGTFECCAIEFSIEPTIPSYESLYIESLNLNEVESESYWNYYDAVEELQSSNETVHRLLGYPNTIQGDMQLQCQLVSHGLYCGDSSGYEDPQRKVLEKSAHEWKLLLQIDSEQNIGMMWGDVGRIYFWIREQDLAIRNFNDTWLVLQCT